MGGAMRDWSLGSSDGQFSSQLATTGTADADTSRSIRLFSTCPPSSQYKGDYLRKVKDIAAWCDDAGIEGILVYTDNSLVDPWLVSQVILTTTSNLAPLVAIQPVYMHPYTAAKMVATFSHLYNRRIFLNMVAGGFVNDLVALGDSTEHDERYDRLIEYVSIMKLLFEGPESVTYTGTYFAIKNLTIKPQIYPSWFRKCLSLEPPPPALGPLKKWALHLLVILGLPVKPATGACRLVYESASLREMTQGRRGELHTSVFR